MVGSLKIGNRPLDFDVLSTPGTMEYVFCGSVSESVRLRVPLFGALEAIDASGPCLVEPPGLLEEEACGGIDLSVLSRPSISVVWCIELEPGSCVRVLAVTAGRGIDLSSCSFGL